MAANVDCPRDTIDPADVRTLAQSLPLQEPRAAAARANAERMADRMESDGPIAWERDILDELLVLARCGTGSCWERSLDTRRPQCQCEVCAAYRRLDAWAERHPPLDPSDIERLCDSVDGSGPHDIIAAAREAAHALRGGEITDAAIDTTVIRHLTDVAECRRLSMPCVSAAELIGECWCNTCYAYSRVMRWLKGMETMP